MEQLDEYLVDCKRYSREGFAAAHPHPWFVVAVPDKSGDKWRAFRTTSVSAWSLIQARAELPAVADVYRALKVVKSADNPWRNRISLGRARNNDVVLRDRSVSKLHAHLTLDDDGQTSLRDAGSRNGTRINGDRIRGKDAIVLVAGDEVRFGRVDAVFQDATAFYDFLHGIINVDQDPGASE